LCSLIVIYAHVVASSGPGCVLQALVNRKMVPAAVSWLSRLGCKTLADIPQRSYPSLHRPAVCYIPTAGLPCRRSWNSVMTTRLLCCPRTGWSHACGMPRDEEVSFIYLTPCLTNHLVSLIWCCFAQLACEFLSFGLCSTVYRRSACNAAERPPTTTQSTLETFIGMVAMAYLIGVQLRSCLHEAEKNSGRRIECPGGSDARCLRNGSRVVWGEPLLAYLNIQSYIRVMTRTTSTITRTYC
jgi:hypothetical protein